MTHVLKTDSPKKIASHPTEMGDEEKNRSTMWDSILTKMCLTTGLDESPKNVRESARKNIWDHERERKNLLSSLLP